MSSSIDHFVRISDSLKSVHNFGAGLFNLGQHLEAFRFYQGALSILMDLFDDRPDLKIIIADGLRELDLTNSNDQLKAYRLHEVIEQVRNQLRSKSPI